MYIIKPEVVSRDSKQLQTPNKRVAKDVAKVDLTTLMNKSNKHKRNPTSTSAPPSSRQNTSGPPRSVSLIRRSFNCDLRNRMAIVLERIKEGSKPSSVGASESLLEHSGHLPTREAHLRRKARLRVFLCRVVVLFVVFVVMFVESK